MKSSKKPYAVLSEFDDFSFVFMDKKKMPDDYSEKERIKIDYFQELVDQFWNEISTLCENQEVYIAMEGLSFASNGNALIDISMATALLRKKIVDYTGSQRFHVFSPTSVKKFAIKGNAKKNELYEALLTRKLSGTNLETFTKILEENKEEWITGGGNVNKPLDDMIDATFICLYLNELITQG
jgi:preprotein translocase subunit Sec63